MKRTIKLLLTFLILVIAFNLNAQQVDKKIQFNGKKQNETITLKISENMESLELNFFSKLESGVVSVKIYDPKKNKKGSFLLFSGKYFDLTSIKINKLKKIIMRADSYKVNSKWKPDNNSPVKDSIPKTRGSILEEKFVLTAKEGELKKIIKNPMKGRWIIQLEGNKAIGNIVARVEL